MKKKILILAIGIIALAGSTWAQNIDPYIDDAYYTQQDEEAIRKEAKERAHKLYLERVARAKEQRRKDSIEYAKYIQRINSQEIDAYNGRLNSKRPIEYAQNSIDDDNQEVYGEYSSRLRLFHKGQDVIINNPSNVNIYRDSYDINRYYNYPYRYSSWGYNSWYSPYVSSYYPWYDSYYPYYDYPYYGSSFGVSIGWNSYPYYSPYYSPYYWNRYYGYSPYYSYGAGYYDGYYSGVYSTRYVNNKHRNGNRSYQSYTNSYSSPYEAVRGIRYNNSRTYREDDGYHSTRPLNSGNRSYRSYRSYSNDRAVSNSNSRGYTRSYRDNSNYNSRSSDNNRSSSSSGNRSYRSSNGSSSSKSLKGYTRDMRR